MSWSKFFSVAIRLVFLFAFGAFLWASIHHVAAFFHNFEPDPNGENWAGSYALAISVDATSLVLTLGVMFFGRDMPMYAKVIVWFFIVALTIFSWVVNWQYALTYQGNSLNVDPFWHNLNPILASSFAFLNLAYSIVAEFFNFRVKTVEEMQKELDDINARSHLEQQLAEMKKGKGFIQIAKEKAIEIREAALEITQTKTEDEEQSAQEIFKGIREKSFPTPEPEDDKKLEKTLEILGKNPNISDEELAKILNLRRPASARFWRLVAKQNIKNSDEKISNIFEFSPRQETEVLPDFFVADDQENSDEKSEFSESFFNQEIPQTPTISEQKNKQDTGDNLQVSDVEAAMEAAQKNQEKREDSNSHQSQNSTAKILKNESVRVSNSDRGYTPEQVENDPRIIAIFSTPGKRKKAVENAIKSGDLRKKSDGKIRENAINTWIKNLSLREEKREVFSI